MSFFACSCFRAVWRSTFTNPNPYTLQRYSSDVFCDLWRVDSLRSVIVMRLITFIARNEQYECCVDEQHSVRNQFNVHCSCLHCARQFQRRYKINEFQSHGCRVRTHHPAYSPAQWWCSQMVHVNCNRKRHDRCASHTTANDDGGYTVICQAPIRPAECRLVEAVRLQSSPYPMQCTTIYASERAWDETEKKICRLGRRERELGTIYTHRAFRADFISHFRRCAGFENFQIIMMKNKNEKKSMSHTHTPNRVLSTMPTDHGWMRAYSIECVPVCVVSIFLFHHL